MKLWHRLVVCCFLTVGSTGLTGCRAAFRPWVRSEPVPIVFQQPPSLPELIQVVNANTDAVRQLQTPSAYLRLNGMTSLQADIAVDRPRRFRLRGALSSLTGKEVDIGSNNDVFWMWVKRQRPRAMYFARHNEFDRSSIAQSIPVRPNWLVEAMGLVQLDPNGRHEGPTAAGPNRIKVRSWIPGPQGQLVRDMIIHEKAGWILEQHVYDSAGNLIASVKAKDHRSYKEHGATLPHKLDIQLTMAQFGNVAFQLQIDRYTINYLMGEEEFLWKMPEYKGFPLVDLSRQSLRSGKRQSPEVLGQRYSRTPDYRVGGYAPRVRGYRDRR